MGKGLIWTVSILAFLIIGGLITLFVIPFQYTATEHRVTSEPYTQSYSECVKRNWFTNRCIDYDRRVVTRYRTVSNDVPVTKTTTLYNLIQGNVDYYYEVRG